jgi:hypothetical protein
MTMPEETHQPKKNLTIEERILEAIRSGDVKMKPRWHFVLQEILGTTAIVIILLIAVYLASFIIFVLHQDGAWFVPVFGLAGWYSLFIALPWILILISTIFILTLALLAQRYSPSYQWPLVYSLLGIFFLITASSFLFVQTSFSETLFHTPFFESVPLLHEYYPGVGSFMPRDIHRGTILATTTDGFLLSDVVGTTSTVLISSGTKFPFGNAFSLDDLVVVFGNRSVSGTIVAVGVEELVP